MTRGRQLHRDLRHSQSTKFSLFGFHEVLNLKTILSSASAHKNQTTMAPVIYNCKVVHKMSVDSCTQVRYLFRSNSNQNYDNQRIVNKLTQKKNIKIHLVTSQFGNSPSNYTDIVISPRQLIKPYPVKSFSFHVKLELGRVMPYNLYKEIQREHWDPPLV